MTEYALTARLPDGSKVGHPLPAKLGDPPTLGDAMRYCGELLKLVDETAEWSVEEQFSPVRAVRAKETPTCAS